MPSDDLFKVFLQMERDFKDFHGVTLSKEPHVFQKVFKIVAPKVRLSYI